MGAVFELYVEYGGPDERRKPKAGGPASLGGGRGRGQGGRGYEHGYGASSMQVEMEGEGGFSSFLLSSKEQTRRASFVRSERATPRAAGGIGCQCRCRLSVDWGVSERGERRARGSPSWLVVWSGRGWFVHVCTSLVQDEAEYDLGSWAEKGPAENHGRHPDLLLREVKPWCSTSNSTSSCLYKSITVALIHYCLTQRTRIASHRLSSCMPCCATDRDGLAFSDRTTTRAFTESQFSFA